MKQCPMCGASYADDAKQCICGYRFGAGADDVAPDAEVDPFGPGDGLWWLGWIVALCGTAAAVLAFTMDVTVSTSPFPYPDLMPNAPQSADVVNLQLLQRQMMVLHASLAAVIGGLVLVTAGAIVRAISAR